MAGTLPAGTPAEPRGRALRLAALLVRKALCPPRGIWSILYYFFGFSFLSTVTPAELRPFVPHVIHFANSVNASLVSAAIPNPPRHPGFFRFFFRAPSSRFLLPPLSAVFFLWMLLQRCDPGLLLRTIFVASFLLRLL